MAQFTTYGLRDYSSGEFVVHHQILMSESRNRLCAAVRQPPCLLTRSADMAILAFDVVHMQIHDAEDGNVR